MVDCAVPSRHQMNPNTIAACAVDASRTFKLRASRLTCHPQRPPSLIVREAQLPFIVHRRSGWGLEYVGVWAKVRVRVRVRVGLRLGWVRPNHDPNPNPTLALTPFREFTHPHDSSHGCGWCRDLETLLPRHTPLTVNSAREPQ